MSEVAPSRKTLFQQDVAYRRSVSEAVLTKVAAQNNFVNSYQQDQKRWNLNGTYSIGQTIDGIDGLEVFFFNTEITGYAFSNGVQGLSGLSEFDIIWYDINGIDQGSIFTTKPTIDTTAANNAVGFENFITTTTRIDAGITLPVFSKKTFFEGESIALRVDSAMVSAQNLSVELFFRPINIEEV